jgi:hypothetical protein
MKCQVCCTKEAKVERKGVNLCLDCDLNRLNGTLGTTVHQGSEFRRLNPKHRHDLNGTEVKL